MGKLLELVKRVLSQRSSVYTTSPDLGHDDVGLLWTALLQNHYGVRLEHPIPGHLVGLMKAADKLNRASIPGFREDDYIDAVGYVDMAYEQINREKIALSLNEEVENLKAKNEGHLPFPS